MAVNCEITRIIGDLTSNYQFGVKSCDYEDSLRHFLQVLKGEDSIKFCTEDCSNYTLIVCSPPTFVSIFNNVLSWKDVAEYTGSYRLEIIDADTDIVVSDTIVTSFTEGSSGEYSLNMTYPFLPFKLYKFLLYKICEEDIESQSGTGCASVLSISISNLTITSNNGYSVGFSIPGFSNLIGGVLTGNLYLEGSLERSFTISSSTFSIDLLTPETDYVLELVYTRDEQETCPLPEISFTTNSNEFRYYTATLVVCDPPSQPPTEPTCSEGDELVVKVLYENELEIDDLYVTLSGTGVTIKEPLLEEIEEAELIEDLDTITCDWYCTCGVAEDIEVESNNVFEGECETATEITVECKNCE